MNPERLLAHFETISEAPDAIARLRRFILDLAVRGKLVEQDPEDEPAGQLLRLIELEKNLARRDKSGKRARISSPDAIQDAPFGLPIGWEWIRLGEILLKLTDGTHHSPPNGGDGDFLYITAKNIKSGGVSLAGVTYVSREVHDEIYARCNPEKGDILYIKDGATTGVAAINDLAVPFSMLSSVALLKLPSCVFNQLLLCFLGSPFFYRQMRGFMKGSAIPRVTLKRMATALLPLPPLAEQNRIVAKVDTLMALCDQLEAARQERQQSRGRLVAATLQRLNEPDEDPASFRRDARFAMQVLPSLASTAAQIKQLRQTILNLAVRGKLVEQDPEDEPAEELLKAISLDSLQSKGRRTTAAGFPGIAIKGSFAVPGSWVWALLGGIGDWGSGSTPPRGRADYYSGDISWFKSGELGDNKSLSDSEEKITHLALGECSFRNNKPGDVLIAMYGATIGKLAILAEEAVTNQAVCACTPCWGVDTQYLYLFLLAKRDDFRLASEGGAQPNISKVKIVNTPIPLPPLAEQHRIVAKVDTLMVLCGQLEQQLNQADQQRRRLLEAVLAEALREPERALAALPA